MTTMSQIGTSSQMDQRTPTPPPQGSSMQRAAAFSVHVFTALGDGVALLALMEAVREHWTAMFWWLGVALGIDGVDGPMARGLVAVGLEPNWSAERFGLVANS